MSKAIIPKFSEDLSQKFNKGFTLIELLIVVMFMGILAAIAMPNLLGQIAKSRQAEAKNGLGTINRAQQAYRLEYGIFTLKIHLPVKLTQQYYYFIDDYLTINSLGMSQWATANPKYSNDILDYTSAVGQTSSGQFQAIICEQTTNPSANDINQATFTDGVPSCGSNSKAIQ